MLGPRKERRGGEVLGRLKVGLRRPAPSWVCISAPSLTHDVTIDKVHPLPQQTFAWPLLCAGLWARCWSSLVPAFREGEMDEKSAAVTGLCPLD